MLNASPQNEISNKERFLKNHTKKTHCDVSTKIEKLYIVVISIFTVTCRLSTHFLNKKRYVQNIFFTLKLKENTGK